MRVIFFDLDTLRPDHLSCYGYYRKTSPNIDAICSDAVKFTNYYCTDAPCLPSRAALLSGRYGINNGAVGHGGSRASYFNEGANRGFRTRLHQSCLTNIFASLKLHTVSFSSFAARHSFYDYTACFNEIYNCGKNGFETADEVYGKVSRWLSDNKDKDDWYLHVNFWDAHTPYRTPENFRVFNDSPLETFLTDEKIAEQHKHRSPHGSLEINMYDDKVNENYPKQLGKVMNLSDYKKLVDEYDNAINYLDGYIGKIVNYLKENGLYEDTNIIVSADHGENMGELNIYSEHATADEYTCKIPMIVKWAGCLKNHTDSGLHEHIDLLPTLADLTGTYKRPIWDGESYAETLKTGKDTGKSVVHLSQMAHVCQRGIRFGDYLYIRTYQDGFHDFPKEMLFDLKNDKYEENNIAKENPAIVKKARIMLKSFLKANLKNGRKDPMKTVLKEGVYHAKGYLEHYADYLKNTNRAEEAKKLIRRDGKYKWAHEKKTGQKGK